MWVREQGDEGNVFGTPVFLDARPRRNCGVFFPMTMKRCFTLLLGLLSATIPDVVVAAERPNILLIVADDMGFSDLGCYGGYFRDTGTMRLDLRLRFAGRRQSVKVREPVLVSQKNSLKLKAEEAKFFAQSGG